MKGLSKGRYDETFAGEDDCAVDNNDIFDHKYCIDPGDLLSIYIITC